MCRLILALAAILMGGTNASTQTENECSKRSPCPKEGCGARPDAGLNVQKNRVGKPPQFTTVSYADFVGLNSQGVNKKMSSNWTTAERTRIATVESSAGIALTAYLFDATLADPETCNCYKPNPADRDFHIWLAENKAGAKKKKFIVIEMTPRIRKSHSGWKLTTLSKLKPKSEKPWTLVRVRGYALFDNEHWDFPKRKIRATAWEIHPVTELSYCTTGDTCDPSADQGWKNLDQLIGRSDQATVRSFLQDHP